jgi:hypothetical protein
VPVFLESECASCCGLISCKTVFTSLFLGFLQVIVVAVTVLGAVFLPSCRGHKPVGCPRGLPLTCLAGRGAVRVAALRKLRSVHEEFPHSPVMRFKVSKSCRSRSMRVLVFSMDSESRAARCGDQQNPDAKLMHGITPSFPLFARANPTIY